MQTLTCFITYCQQKVDHNVLTPAKVKYFKRRIPFEQKVTFGVKNLIGLNYFNSNSNLNNSIGGNSLVDLKPLLGFGVIGNFKNSHHFSMRNELHVAYGRYLKKNVNYTLSFSWLFNYHFKEHAYINLGIQPSVVMFENNYIEALGRNESDVSSALEVNGIFGVEYPLNDNLDLGLRLVKSFNSAFKTELPDYQGVVFSLTYYWHKFSSADKKLMIHKERKMRFQEQKK